MQVPRVGLLNFVERKSALVVCRGAFCALAVGLLLYCPALVSAADWKFDVSFSPKLHPDPYTGRVYLLFSSGDKEPPRFGPHWFNTEPFVALDVADWKPGERLSIGPDTPGLLAYPSKLSELPLEGLRAQAVVRFNPVDREIGKGAGNGYSEVLTIGPAEGGTAPHFDVDRIVPPEEFRQSKWARLCEVPSPSLSEFHHRPVSLRGAVMLPAGYYHSEDRRYPVIFSIPGFGGTHHLGELDAPVPEQNEQGVEFIRVVLDPSCPLGHHVFADSENNGPVGTALVTEFIPELDRRFRTIPESRARFLTGHSSGGWSSLWLQIAYPETFGGTWSTAPDPVDFRDFQQIDLYRPGTNMYVDEKGVRRPLARKGNEAVLWYREFAAMEETLGDGGQLHSFEAVFSPKGADGKPRLLWNRETGAIDTDVAKTWEKYDIRLVLERNWDVLGPKLKGKLHVIMGDLDTFYLEGAVRLLKESLAKLESDADVELVPGKDHRSLMSRELTLRMRKEMVEAFLAKSPAEPAR